MSSGRTEPARAVRPHRSKAASAVCVVDPQTSLAEALAEALRRQSGFSSVVATGDPRVAAWAVESERVDVALVGIDADTWDAADLIRWATRRRPGVAVVTMSRDDDPRSISSALLAGARSWVPKRIHLDELTAVLLAAHRGESYLPPQTLSRVLDELARDAAPPVVKSPWDKLTARERDVLENLSLGLSRAEIAAELGLSLNTVRTHLHRVLVKLDVHTALEAVSLVLLSGSAQRPGGPSLSFH